MNAPYNPDLLAQLQSRYASKPVRMLIGGNWVESASGETFETLNPSTGELIANVASANEADVDSAVAAARAAFEGPWSKVKPDQRSRMLAISSPVEGLDRKSVV